MKSKKLLYFRYIVKISVILVILGVIESSCYKMESTSSNENVNKSVDLSTMALFIDKETKKEEKEHQEAIQKYLWGSLDSYTGDLTGYGADCPLCTGRLACMSKLDISNGKNTYKDKTYGEVSIVASSKNLPCGSIIKFESKKISKKPIVAIVLDRGVLGNDIDLLAPSEDYAMKYIGRQAITYDVLRIGWEK